MPTEEAQDMLTERRMADSEKEHRAMRRFFVKYTESFASGCRGGIYPVFFIPVESNPKKEEREAA
jgi:hypothetical protein